MIAGGSRMEDLAADLDAGYGGPHPVAQREIGLGFGDARQGPRRFGRFRDAKALVFEFVDQPSSLILHNADGRLAAADDAWFVLAPPSVGGVLSPER